MPQGSGTGIIAQGPQSLAEGQGLVWCWWLHGAAVQAHPQGSVHLNADASRIQELQEGEQSVPMEPESSPQRFLGVQSQGRAVPGMEMGMNQHHSSEPSPEFPRAFKCVLLSAASESPLEQVGTAEAG